MNVDAYHKVATSEDATSMQLSMSHKNEAGVPFVATGTAVMEQDGEDDDYPHTWKDAYFQDKPNVEVVFDHFTPEEQDSRNFVFFAKLIGGAATLGLIITLSICVGEFDPVAIALSVSFFLVACLCCSHRGELGMAWCFTSMPVYHTALTTTGLSLVQSPRPGCGLPRGMGMTATAPQQRPLCVLHVPYSQIRNVEICPIDVCTPDTLKVEVKTKSTDETIFIRTGIPSHTPRTFLTYYHQAEGNNAVNIVGHNSSSTNNTNTTIFQQISLYGLEDPYRFKKYVLRKVQQQAAAAVAPQEMVRVVNAVVETDEAVL